MSHPVQSVSSFPDEKPSRGGERVREIIQTKHVSRYKKYVDVKKIIQCVLGAAKLFLNAETGLQSRRPPLLDPTTSCCILPFWSLANRHFFFPFLLAGAAWTSSSANSLTDYPLLITQLSNHLASPFPFSSRSGCIMLMERVPAHD